MEPSRKPFRSIKRRLEAAEFAEPAIVPRKAEAPVGTLSSILSQAHIDPADGEKLG